MGKNYIHMFMRTEVLVYAKGVICLSTATLFAPKTARFAPVKAFAVFVCFLVLVFQPFRSHQMQRVVCYLRNLQENVVFLSG